MLIMMLDVNDDMMFQDVLVQYLTTDDIKLNAIDAEDPEVTRHTDRHIIMLRNIHTLAVSCVDWSEH